MQGEGGGCRASRPQPRPAHQRQLHNPLSLHLPLEDMRINEEPPGEASKVLEAWEALSM